jgi:hypothetical protein
MDGEKFDEERFRTRAKLIQGQTGFLGQRDPKGKKWIECLLGDNLRTGVYDGPAVKGADGKLAEKPWVAALRAAAFDDDDSVFDVKSSELVLVKLKHRMNQLHQEGGLSLDEAQGLLSEAEEIVRQTSSGSGFAVAEAKRKVAFVVDRIRITSIDTGNWTFDTMFTVNLKWQLNKKVRPLMILYCNTV